MAKIRVENVLIDVPDDATPEELDGIAASHAGGRSDLAAESPFEVSRRTDTLNVPPDQTERAYGEMRAQARDVSAAVAPVAIPLAVTAAAGPALGFAARAGMAGLSGAAGEAGRQLIRATGGEIEPSSAEAAKKVAGAGAVNAALGVAGETAVAAPKLVLKTISSVGREATDFFARLARGTTKTAGELPLKATTKPLPTVDEVVGFGQQVADTLKDRTNELGKAVAAALAKADKRAPTGAVPIEKASQIIENFAAERGVYKTIAGPNGALRKPLEAALEKLQIVGGGTGGKLSYSQLDNLAKEIDEATSFDPTNFGDEKAAAAAKKQLQVVTGRMRDLLPPSVRKAKAALGAMADTSTTITNNLDILRGQKVGVSDVSAVAKKLVKLIKQNSVEAEAFDRAMREIDAGGELTRGGRELAVRQQLQGEPSADSPGVGGVMTRALQSITAPTARAAAPYVSKLLRIPTGVADVIPNPASTRLLPPILAAMNKKRGKNNDGRR